MPHICMITTDHSPLDDRIFYKEALSLQEAGYKVSILCREDENGRLHNLKGEVINEQSETPFPVNGINIRGIHPKGNAVLNKFFLSRFYKKIIHEGVNLNADVYHVHEPETVLIGQAILKKLPNAKLIFDSHEFNYGNGSKEKFIRRFYYPKLQYLITANQVTRGAFLSNLPHLKTETIYNYPDQNVFKPVYKPGKLQKPLLVHEGMLKFNRGLKEMLKVLKLLAREYPEIVLSIVGGITEESQAYFKQKVEEEGLSGHVRVTGWIDYHQVPQFLEDAAIGLILKTETVNNILGGPPIKLFNYFNYGIAVVDVDMPETTRILNETDAGISVKDRSVNNIYQAVKYLLDNPGTLSKYCENAFQAGKTRNWQHEKQKLLRYYRDEVLRNHPFQIR